VEGGAATLIVTPSGQSVLMDAGWDAEAERDAKRIVAAMDDAGIASLDYFIASHFHGDHTSGLPALARRVPIGQFIDHGDSVEQDSPRSVPPWEAYRTTALNKRRTVVPGDELPLTGVDFRFVTSNRVVLEHALVDSGVNAYCARASAGERMSGENASSVGYLLGLGYFQFLNVGDLTVNYQHALACPRNLIGVIDLLQVPHHGNGIAPQLTWALAPTAAVLNNGPHKGGSPEGFEAISTIPGIQAVWQIHRALDTDDDHNASARMTANLTEEGDAGHWIKATVRADGSSYTIVNGRNAYSETYATK
jgi:competence protein ComEC